MAVYYMNSYDIENIEAFKNYGPLVVPLLHKYGAEIIASDRDAIALEGKARTMNAIIKFPSEEAALQCYNDPEYQEAKKIRTGSTKNCTLILVKEFSNKDLS
jgi:uncharacterized protein (DUF1330 family)